MNDSSAASAAARANILGRLAAAPPGNVPAAPVNVPLPPMGAGPYERFCELLVANRAEVTETTEAGLTRAVLDWLRTAGCRNALYGPQTALGRDLAAAAGDDDDIRLVPYDRDIEALKSAMVEDIDAGITESCAAIAATGSVALRPGPSEPRLMSLLPPIHLVVVRKSTLRPTLSDVMREQGWAKNGMPTNMVLVSGPSKTADIAQILAFGVHGPKRLAVLVVTDA